ncbi:MAG: hypothetical protein QGG97_02490 [Flavobacteriales bacterium]|jgi:predicted small lipoprotein YifL|nr:hypothetical protein [Flavobacteriales bacterium]|tara:strand:+ start:292 stop:447 length:156 start_codon:yes stop_codon:yes gene_type:complete
MKKKILAFIAIFAISIMVLTGCSLSGLDLKVDEATTDKANKDVNPLLEATQ